MSRTHGMYETRNISIILVRKLTGSEQVTVTRIYIHGNYQVP
jgi:hypothetical protein